MHSGLALRCDSRLLDRVAQTLLWLLAALVCGVFCWLLFDIVIEGGAGLSWSFLSQLPEDAGRAGGIASILVATLAVLVVCLSVALPIGLGTAIWLAEYSDHLIVARWVRRSLQLLAGVPSIVIGLFGYAFFCRALGLGYSLLAGGLTLACMVLPLLVGALEAGLRAVPEPLRQGAAALGLSQAGTLLHLLLPAAAPALMAGLILSVGRALAETAALLFTSGYVTRMPESLADSGRVLSVHIFDLTMNVAGGDHYAYTTALVLLGLLCAINALARLAVGVLFNGNVRRNEQVFSQ